MIEQWISNIAVVLSFAVLCCPADVYRDHAVDRTLLFERKSRLQRDFDKILHPSCLVTFLYTFMPTEFTIMKLLECLRVMFEVLFTRITDHKWNTKVYELRYLRLSIFAENNPFSTINARIFKVESEAKEVDIRDNAFKCLVLFYHQDTTTRCITLHASDPGLRSRELCKHLRYVPDRWLLSGKHRFNDK